MQEMPLRRKCAAVEFIGKAGNLCTGFVVWLEDRGIRIPFPGLRRGGGLRRSRSPEAATHFGPAIHPLDGIEERGPPRKSRIAVEIRIQLVDRVIEHVILAGIVGEHHISAWANPLVSVRCDGNRSARCEGQQRHTILIEKGSGGSLRASYGDAVAAQRTIATARG